MVVVIVTNELASGERPSAHAASLLTSLEVMGIRGPASSALPLFAVIGGRRSLRR